MMSLWRNYTVKCRMLILWIHYCVRCRMIVSWINYSVRCRMIILRVHYCVKCRMMILWMRKRKEESVICRENSNCAPNILILLHLVRSLIRIEDPWEAFQVNRHFLSAQEVRIHLIQMRIQILDPHWVKWVRIQVISLRFTKKFKQSRIFKQKFFFSLIYFVFIQQKNSVFVFRFCNFNLI